MDSSPHDGNPQRTVETGTGGGAGDKHDPSSTKNKTPKTINAFLSKHNERNAPGNGPIPKCNSFKSEVSGLSGATCKVTNTRRDEQFAVHRRRRRESVHSIPEGHVPNTARVGGPIVDYLHPDDDVAENDLVVQKKGIGEQSTAPHRDDDLCSMTAEAWEVEDARPILPKIAFFMGDLRDGLPMINMQTTFLMTAKNYTEKQVGTLFFVFGVSQFVAMPLSGYLLDYTNNKIQWVQWAALTTSGLTVFTAIFAQDYGANLTLMAITKIVQGCASTLLPLGLHSVTLGIVGSTGMTSQVARNKVMNHLGTALIVAIGTFTVFLTYPHTNKMGFLFVVSPIWCMALLYYLWMIKPSQVDRDAARGLIIESPTMTEYEELDAEAEILNSSEVEDSEADDSDGILNGIGMCTERRNSAETSNSSSSTYPLKVERTCDAKYVPPSVPPLPKETCPAQKSSSQMNSSQQAEKKDFIDPLSMEAKVDMVKPSFLARGPSFVLGFGARACSGSSEDSHEPKRPRAQTPLWVLSNPTLLIFTIICFLFHLGNSAVLPLVMQTLAVEDARKGVFMSGLCIFIAQAFMSVFAKISGDYSPVWGRKKLFLVGLFSLPVRCFFLYYLCQMLLEVEAESSEEFIIHGLILATQFLDAIGAGIFGTLYILVTNDIAAETGRFNLMIGVTSGAMCLGGTVSGYVGQAVAQDIGYHAAFAFLGIMSLFPAFMYLFCMPETLPEYAKWRPKKSRKNRFARIRNFLLRKKQQSALASNSNNESGVRGSSRHIELV